MSDTDLVAYVGRLKEAVVSCDLDNVEALAKAALNAGTDPLAAIQDGLAKGIQDVGEKYGRGEAYLPELVMAATVMKKGVSVLEPHIPKGVQRSSAGKVVIGTVEGDIHDIGKSLVGTILGTNGYDVVDLGVDISADKFINAASAEKPSILGMSALMTTTMIHMPDVISGLASKGIRKDMVVMIGGAPTTKEWAKEIGADAQAGDAVEASELARKMVPRK